MPSDPPSPVAPVSAAQRRRLLLQRCGGSQLSGHEAIAVTLRQLGVTHVYGVSGTPIHETLAGCAAAGLRVIGVRHQQTAVLASQAQNFLAGTIRGVPVLSAGPAITNAVTGIHFARENCWPMLVIGGRRPLQTAGQGEFQDLDAVPLMATVAKRAELVSTSAELSSRICAAVALALAGRPGPVYLDVCAEALQGRAARADLVVEPPPCGGVGPDPAALERAAALLCGARRPAVIFGKGVRWRDGHLGLRALVEALELPFVASPMGRGLLPEDHGLACSAIAGFVQARADVVLVVGARLNWQFRFGQELAPEARLIRIDIEPEETTRGRPAEVALVGDAAQVLAALLERVQGEAAQASRSTIRRSWVEEVQGAKGEQARSLASLAPAGASGSSIGLEPLMRTIAGLLPRDAITVLDGHLTLLAGQRHIPVREPFSRLTVGVNGCLGVGLPFALAAGLTFPGREVVALCGDSAFAFSAMDFETAVRHRVPLIVVVVDNEGIWGAHIQSRNYPPAHERVAMYSPGLRYERLAEAFGGHAEHVCTLDELAPAFARARTAGRPALIHVKVDPHSPVPDAGWHTLGHTMAAKLRQDS